MFDFSKPRSNFQNPHLSLTNLPSKQQVINEIKQNPILSPIFKTLAFTENDIINSYANLIDYVQEQNDPNRLFITNIKRGYNGQINFTKTLNHKSPYITDYKLLNNIKFKYISSPMTSESLSHLQITSESESGFKHMMEINSPWLINENKFRGFFLYGDAESSRNLMLSALTNEFALMNKKVAYLNINNLDSYSKTFIRRNSEDIVSEINDFLTSILYLDVIIFDELGLKKFSNWFLETFLEPLLTECVANKKIVIFGSYYTPELLDKQFFKDGYKDDRNGLTPMAKKILMLINKLSNYRSLWIGNKKDK
ncbi:hypothetical protein ACXYRQ_00965 [Mycoplasma sp. 394]|uniref:hypothetical protein n=1 Tax=Mycoplasma sp. 6243 TaxID=3440865 RepID=UPI003EB9D95F